MNETKAIRTELGLNQREFGERLGMSQSRVAHWERGADTPDTRTLLAMRWLLHQHRTADGEMAHSEMPSASAEPFRDPAALAAILHQLGGHTVIAEEATRVNVPSLEGMETDGWIWPQYRRPLVEFARIKGFELDADRLTLRPLGKDSPSWRAA